MRLAAHGISVDLPAGWHGGIHRHPDGQPTLHIANFPLPARDGDFGTRTTARMPAGGVFASLTEYAPGAGLTAGRGLFAAQELPLPLPARALRADALLVARPGQRGAQRFFTVRGRPLCLYVVARDPIDLRGLHAALAELVIEPARGR
jgi:hypothetical protein